MRSCFPVILLSRHRIREFSSDSYALLRSADRRVRLCIAVVLCSLSPSTVFSQEPVTSNPSAATIVPTEVIKLFEEGSFSKLYSWLETTAYEDPKQVFSVTNGILRISGEVAGYLATKDRFRDYHLVAEYRWGERTYGSKTVRNSGILLHGVGHDGNRSPWMASIECQIAQGCVGDFIVIRGNNLDGTVIPVTITSDVVIESDGKTRWRSDGKPTEYFGRQFWWSHHDPDFKELIDTRGRYDVESPLQEWTRVECICDGDRITVIVNGTVVNECYRAFPSSGKVLLESEGFEILFRKFELHPLRKTAPSRDRIPRTEQ